MISPDTVSVFNWRESTEGAISELPSEPLSRRVLISPYRLGILQVPDDPQLVFAADHLLERRDRAAAGQRRFRLCHRITSSNAFAATFQNTVRRKKVDSIIFVHTCAIAPSGARLRGRHQGATR